VALFGAPISAVVQRPVVMETDDAVSRRVPLDSTASLEEDGGEIDVTLGMLDITSEDLIFDEVGGECMYCSPVWDGVGRCGWLGAGWRNVPLQHLPIWDPQPFPPSPPQKPSEPLLSSPSLGGAPNPPILPRLVFKARARA